MALNIHASNRLDSLSRHLTGFLKDPLSKPFQTEIVIVSSLGIRRWLSLEIARLNDVCANIQFPFIADFVDSLQSAKGVGRVRPSIQEITWKIHRVLPDFLKNEEFSVVRGYLSDSDPLKLFQLSERVAQLFDQYFIYRPQMVRRWTKRPAKKSGKLQGDETWESILWRQIFNDEGLQRVGKLLPEEEATNAAQLPPRVFIFAPSVLPPLHLEALFQ